MSGSDEDSGEPPTRALQSSWGGLASLSGAGGGRVDGAFLTEPGSYEDFHYPSPFDYNAFAALSPGGGVAGHSSRPYSPFSSVHQRIPSSSNPFSPLHSFSPYPTYGSPSSRVALPPAPPTPPPLFDEGETALFDSFLNTLDVDPNFLFNPVLPPGMPSPPSASMLREQPEEERREREQLGHSVGGLSLGVREQLEPPFEQPPNLATKQPRARWAPPRAPEVPKFEQDGEEEDDGEDTARPEDDDDPDFEPEPRGARRKSKSGGVGTAAGKSRGEVGGGRGGKKARVQPETAPFSPMMNEEEAPEDVEMSIAPPSNDGEDSVATVTASGRPRRNTRAPRRLSTSASSASTNASGPSISRAKPSLARPSLSKPIPPPAPSTTSRTRARSSALSGSPPAPHPATSGSPPSTSASSASRTAPLTESEKRSNHIASEQRRRNAIKSGFQDLVDLLVAGSAASGIYLAAGGEDEGGGKGGKGKGKGTGRGRGRKGEVATSASKSVVLEKAASYILWLERGNRALEGEVERVGKVVEEGMAQAGKG
ncbi:hypothetical protein JCM8547_000308 [Rhodosporidiobolus lusitaniae]